MRAAAAVAERELRVAFRSPVAYAVVGFYLLIHGIFFVLMLEEFSKKSFALVARGTPGPEHNLMDQVLQPLLTWDATLLLFLLPALTMRLFSDEWRSGTSDLLLTYPLRELEIVVGKLASAATLLLLLVALGALHAVGVAAFGRIEPAMLVSGQVGLLLCGLTMLAVGLLWSALTENQVIAFIATMVTLLVFTFAGTWAGPQSGGVGAAVRWLSPLAHVNPFGYGVPSLSDTFYFVSTTAFFASLTTGVLEGAALARAEGAVTHRRNTLRATLSNAAWTAAGSRLSSAALWIVATGLLAALVSRHDLRVDVTVAQRRTLSPQTIQVMKLLERPVHVLAFYSDETAPRTQARLLLASYQEYSKQLSWEFVDLDRHPELAQSNAVSASGTMVLQSGDLKLKVAQPSEANLTGAVLRLMEQRPPRVLFLTGHNEASLADTSRGGLSKLGELVARQNFQVQGFALSGAPRVPPETDLVVLAAPEQPMSVHERDALIAYLLRGGHLLAMVEPAGAPDADSLLARFGVLPKLDFVVDPSEARRNLAGPGSFRIALAQGGNAAHPITRAFTGAALFPLARSLDSVQPPLPGVAATRLVETAPEAWGETDFAFLVDGNPTFDPRFDLPGPLPLAYAVEVSLRRFLLQPGPEEQGLTGLLRDYYGDGFDARDSSLADTVTVSGNRFVAALAEQARVVVVGDVDYVNNANLLVRGNADLFLSMLLWLTDRENRIALAPRPDTSNPVVLTRRQLQTVAVLGIVALPAIPLALGVWVFWRRRRWL